MRIALEQCIGFVCTPLNIFGQVPVAGPEVGVGVVYQMRVVRPAA